MNEPFQKVISVLKIKNKLHRYAWKISWLARVLCAPKKNLKYFQSSINARVALFFEVMNH